MLTALAALVAAKYVPTFISSVIALASSMVAAAINPALTIVVVLVGAAGLILAGVFTVRSNIAGIWEKAYEGERVLRERAEAERDEQRELKHTALSDAKGYMHLLEVEKAKTDLSSLSAKLNEIHEEEMQTFRDTQSAAMREIAGAIMELQLVIVNSQEETAAKVAGAVVDALARNDQLRRPEA